ncbi:hypothetical protein ACIQMJ_00670 [Actinosynnema sp. NPDC091369]
MLDLRADGTPRARRWIELLGIVLFAAPGLAITLRTSARRAVDRPTRTARNGWRSWLRRGAMAHLVER